MRKTRPIRIQNILSQSGQLLGNLCQKAMHLQALQVIVKQALKSNIARHCQVSNYQRGVLTIQVDSSAWATRLRYDIPDLLSRLRTNSQYAGLITIKVNVRAGSNL